MLASIFSDLDNNYDHTVSWRRYLHQHPELSFQEIHTAEFIAGKLRSFGLDVRTQVGGNGVIGVLQGEKAGKTIALRADFDALPIIDEKEVAYKSLNPGVMHACGHDGHTFALLSVAQTLSKFRDCLKGKVLFIFQHAEELPPGGAKSMIAERILDDVDYVFAAHLATELPLGKIAVGEGHKMAAVDKFEITIQGKGGHGAKPEDSIDSIVIGSEIVGSLQKIVSRRISPLQSAVVTIGVFQAGTAFNIIADTAKLEGTVRTFDANVRDKVENEINAIVKGVTTGFHATYKMDYLRGYPALFNHKEETETVRNILSATFTDEAIIPLETSMGAEDFSYFLQERPGTYFKVGARNEKDNTHYPHHHPRFDFDERALLNIEKCFVKIVLHYLF
ncbi:amidohydrolase [Peribacillus loiseleuriae]|uniref:Peptidase M20 n=1 Tax=Peribacillus loiseleuriae TaxID=1679170 RepID=A0A0K9H0C8_9BACI|nr:amidohydrolase [Peribacillus loiseleuriae]KMY52321.1 peptidase M20 [Peribacillus loiseleuriae]